MVYKTRLTSLSYIAFGRILFTMNVKKKRRNRICFLSMGK